MNADWVDLAQEAIQDADIKARSSLTGHIHTSELSMTFILGIMCIHSHTENNLWMLQTKVYFNVRGFFERV